MHVMRSPPPALRLPTPLCLSAAEQERNNLKIFKTFTCKWLKSRSLSSLISEPHPDTCVRRALELIKP